MGTRNLGGADTYNKMRQMNNGITNSTISLVSLHLMVHCCLTLPQFLKRKNTRRIATPPPVGDVLTAGVLQVLDCLESAPALVGCPTGSLLHCLDWKGSIAQKQERIQLPLPSKKLGRGKGLHRLCKNLIKYHLITATDWPFSYHISLQLIMIDLFLILTLQK